MHKRIIASSCVVAFALAAFALGCGSGNDARDIETRCERVREHLVELALPAHDATNIDRETRAGVIRRAMGKQFLASCARSMDEQQANCLLSAADSKSAFACTSRAPGRLSKK